jgi:hypothetical protein
MSYSLAEALSLNASEPAERLNTRYLPAAGETEVSGVPAYRGEGQCFG